jgi:hypothetical protein
LYVQEFHEAEDSVSFETVWLAGPVNGTKLDDSHIDLDVHGKIETARWFSESEVKDVKVFPKRLQGTFWANMEGFLQGEDPFLGVS